MSKSLKVVVAILLLALNSLVWCGQVYAAGLAIQLVINPNQTDVYPGAEPIALAVIAQGTNLTFAWTLLGPGALDGQGSAVFYTPPAALAGSAEQAVVTVTVRDEAGQEYTKSVTFRLLPNPTQAATPTPSPQPTPTPLPTATPVIKAKSGGMGTGTKIVLGAGALAALGGGIALLVSGSGDEGESASCAGTKVGGYCWYLGAKGASCTSACNSHGGYHEATRTFAGSAGIGINCQTVLSAIGARSNTFGSIGVWDFQAVGCNVWINPANVTDVRWNRGTDYTTPEASQADSQRACACNR